MPIVILLSTLSPQGVQTLKSNPERLRPVNQDVEELGAGALHQWATPGEADVKDLRRGGRLHADGKVAQQDGRWL